ncbi:hypothetical protein SAY86_011575 [Trapa natans]|uniref:DEAD-box RNA helicase Q domain-containing protein n=1 Tax=Trapa natans TaxID=22666 RepID=A0AAN7R2X8_TRANT|nr:hypothetical protein SAY86_011575 [Trapa natans]
MLAKSACPSLNLNPPRPDFSWKVNPLHPRAVQFGRCNRSHARAVRNGRSTAVRAGYTRTPLDTPGAYQLIDDDTGEKFIVWGGADDDEFSIPSKSVLSWKPSAASSNGKNNEGSEKKMATAMESDSTSSGLGGARSFNRLKAQRVKALTKQRFPLKGRSREYNGEGTHEAFGHSHSEVGLKMTKNPAMRRHEDKVPGAERLRAIRESILRSNSEGVDIYVKQDKPDLGLENCATKHSVAGGSNLDFQGWGKGGSSRGFQSESANLRKQHNKSSENSDFFSRKSFTDIGCNEFLIESLRKQLFQRPSHIQVCQCSLTLENSCSSPRASIICIFVSFVDLFAVPCCCMLDSIWWYSFLIKFSR